MRRILLAAAFAVLAGCSQSSTSSSEASAPAADFALPDPSGRTVRLSDYKGTVVLLDFWATWCGPCVAEVPDLNKIQSDLGGADFTILGVAIEDASMTDVREFVAQHKVVYPVAYAEMRPAGYKIRGLPTAYLIDAEGRIRKSYLGPKEPKELREQIQKLLQEGKS
jgi:peroxiredoxin